MNTVIGADPIAPRPEDIAAAKRLANVQQVFENNQTKASLMEAMKAHDICVTELAEAMEYKIDIIAYLRDMDIPDGFMGLKVWPREEVDKFYKWQAATPNALNLIGPRPTYAQAQATMDREFANNKLNPAHAIPWH